MDLTESPPTLDSLAAGETPAPGALPAVAEFVLADQQLELYGVLSERSEKAAEWYRGGLIALSNRADPERFVHAAQSIRELMEKLHKLIEVPAQSDSGTLKGKFRGLAQIWDEAKRASSCHDGEVWEGPIDHHLRKGLTAVDKTIEWFLANRPTFRQVSLAVFKELDVSKLPLPPSIEREHFKEWRALYDFFQAVAHHLDETDDAEFGARLYAFERFVLDKVRPRTSEEQRALDKLIAEAESGT